MDAATLKTEALKWLGIAAGSTGPDVDAAGLVTPAVVAFVDRLPGLRTTTTTEGATEWAPDVKLAAVMLAARLIRRRNSPQGIAAFTQEGGAAYVSRNDPDVAQLLRLGTFAAPRVG